MPETFDSLARVFEAAARDNGPLPRIRAADLLARELTGQQLCTAMVFDRQAMTVQRIFSSRPSEYPVGGRKPKRDTEWGRQVLLEGRRFEGEGEVAIRAHFADHEVILGLGLRSIVNLPILVGGACVGTLNLLWPGETLSSAHIVTARLLALLAAPDWPRSPRG
ncbi:GAF domain-containing protein [Pseudoroseomonas wenyumeiae]|uniref:GAF domain-containing protein n=1 Tax=Teichococcus wenyumeiae TaxID=2478470 RepID=A0A3A9JFQ5_9PROT|nr:GAF domain-containing protein [Pseudoroseomonas wenyumeiae]RKK06157.1 GAF domain-containing protein [Pseudoroseomonas wenyumeiae]RMI19759.1 GAF domain-containing protein [Pseudoroseomonas wenyumeiae]